MKKYQRLYEMANLTKSDTGLNYRLWIQTQTGKEKHWARIKIEVDNEFIPMSITDEPEIMVKSKKEVINSKDLNEIKKWVVMNQGLLLKYWNSKGEMSLQDFFKKMKKLNKEN